MRNKVTGSTSGSGGCGCGGGSAKECHCGQASCQRCNLEGFVRPRFFSGQLLTEEDLQLLDAYTVAKNRLHNRHFWGDGVVCGLEVTQHPCGEGKILVAPGYALDCCGNDIVVACKQELDVNRMVRDLRTKMKGGYDCGDPCADKKKVEAALPQLQTRREDTAVAFPGGIPATTDNDLLERTPARFCLYVTYCESESDPVSPYSTGDECGGSGCEASRVREGFRFELRCEEEAKRRPSIQTAACKCIGDPQRVANSAAATMIAGWYYHRFSNAAAYVKNPDDSDAAIKLEQANTELRKIMPDTIDDKWVADFFDEALTLSEPVIAYTARTFRPSPPAIAVPLTESRSKRRAAGPPAAEVLNPIAASDTIEWIAALSSAPAVQKEMRQNRTEAELENVKAISADAQFLATYGSSPIEPREEHRRRLAANIILTDAFATASEKLLTQVARDINLPQRTLPPHVPRLENIPQFSITDPKANQSAYVYFDNVGKTFATFQTGVATDYRDCFCNAVLPPCSVCDEESVLLACISVLDCEVVDICNLERRFVITPVNLRYWIPHIEKLGQSLEQWCCEEPVRDVRGWDQIAELLAESCVRDPATAMRVASSLRTIQRSRVGQSPALGGMDDLFGFGRLANLEARIRKLEGNGE